MNTSDESLLSADVLLVDDTPANIEVLSGMLRERGFRVRAALSGERALAAAATRTPDLILLDITMPEMDGFEVCRRLKADPALVDVPVIFISARDEVVDKVTAFEVGGLDYIPKPFQYEEVEARVVTHLRLRRQQAEIEQQRQTLAENLEQLQKLERARDNLTHMIVHDLRSPLMCILGFLWMLEDPTIAPEPTLLEGASLSAKEMRDLIDNLLDASRMESGEMPLDKDACNLRAIADQVHKRMQLIAQEKSIALSRSGQAPVLQADKGLVSRLITNLVSNALKYTPREGRVEVAVSSTETCCRVEVRDTGPGIPVEYQERIFEKFGQVELGQRRAHSTGVGLAFCRMVVEAHGGDIGVISDGEGSTFWFELPLVLVEQDVL